MISASKEFKEKLKNGANVVNYADFTLSDGTVLHLEPKDFMIGGCEIEDKTTDGKFGVGFVIGKTLTLRISNHEGQLSRYDFYNSIINLYAALLLDDGSIEKIRKGVYYTLVPETPGDIIEISAVDGMYKLDKDYAANGTVYPATLQKIITDVCLDCGIPIGFTQFDNMTFVVQTKPENATTYRQVLSWACQIAGYNARIDNTGYMKLIWYDESLLDGCIYNGGDFYTYPHDTVVDGGNFKDYTTTTVLSGGNFTDDIAQHISKVKSINVHTDDIQITGVRVHGEEETFSLFGEEGYVIEVKDNPFVIGRENEVASYLGNRMVGMVFRPFDAEILSNPLYEPFEVVRVSDAKGSIYLSLINSVTYKIGSFTKIACEAEDPVRNGSTYVSAAAQAVVEARRNAQKQISEYDKSVQNMNELAMNALGFFETVEIADDGSRITYMHDKPTLEESMTIYKRSIDGFFVSQDGGESYTGGFDSQGNAIVNVIYAIGIVADWIRSGRFECKKGNKTTFLADVDTGEVRIIADFFSLSSGDTIDSIAKEEADNAVSSQTQEDIFNKLTNNKMSSAIILRDGDLYINADYIESGTLAGLSVISKGSDFIGSSLYSLYTKMENGRLLFGYAATNAGMTDGNYNSNISNYGNGMRFTAPIREGNLSYNEFSPKFSFIFDYHQNANKENSVITIEPSKSSGGSVIIGRQYGTLEMKGNIIICPVTTFNSESMKDVEDSSKYGIGWSKRPFTVGAYPMHGIYPVVSNKGSSSASILGTGIEGSLWCQSVTATSLTVSGYKSRVSKTENYGDLHQYCYEMATPYFGDIGSGETDENGECHVSIDDKFSETCGECPYYVFLQKEGEGDIWVEKKEVNHFVVKGTSNLKFSWEIKQKQRGYENYRLDSIDGQLESEAQPMEIDEIYQEELLSMEDFYEQQYYQESN